MLDDRKLFNINEVDFHLLLLLLFSFPFELKYLCVHAHTIYLYLFYKLTLANIFSVTQDTLDTLP